MAKKKGSFGFIELDYHAMEKMRERYIKAGADYKQAAEKALTKSREFVANKLMQDTVPQNFPAQGEYGKGEDIRSQILFNSRIGWSGTSAKTGAGFKLNQTLVPQYLMYGTPRMKPAKKLKQDLFGRNTGRQLREIQEEVMWDFLEEALK